MYGEWVAEWWAEFNMEAKLEAAFEGHAITSNVSAIAALSPVVYKVRLRHCDWNVRFFSTIMVSTRSACFWSRQLQQSNYQGLSVAVVSQVNSVGLDAYIEEDAAIYLTSPRISIRLSCSRPRVIPRLRLRVGRNYCRPSLLAL
ncbi:hypothetical protein SCLCIDRAFT_247757 [Scleroderma citrinum Foug A]|uniref:Uncharacterized protein n=1 Tax=Scleroderma citrinum Foug A TaxID=1036808 RepID=A0A0C3DJ02_9AGAM|nr:hypothetical protein SCLCIDRAFT_247757 [Scleroderma citrinum Foug A]